MSDRAQWIKEAEENAKKYSNLIKQNNQYLIDELVNSKNNSLDQLQKAQDNAIYKINASRSTINQNNEDAAKQLNINRLLALKDNSSSMNRAGLGTQGIVGSQVNSINNNYGTNLTELLKNRTSELNNLEMKKNDANLGYDTDRINLLNEYGKNLANLRSEIDSKALNQYNTSYNQYLNMKQQEYDDAQKAAAQAEAIRQFNDEMAYKRELMAQEKLNNDRNYNLSLQKLYASSGGSRGSGGSLSFDDDTDSSKNNQFQGTNLNRTMSVKMSNKTAQKFSDELPEVMNSTYLEKYLAQKQKEANLSENDIEKILQSYGYK